MYTSSLTRSHLSSSGNVRRGLTAVAVLIALTAGFTVRADAQAITEARVSISASKPANTAALKARFFRPTPQGQVLTLSITLPLRNQAQLASFLHHLYTPGDPLYHHFLTGSQFHSEYCPTQMEYDNVVGWAQIQGLTVNRTFASRTILSVRGTVSVIDHAFAVNIGDYKLPGGGLIYSHDHAPQLPLQIGSEISGVVGLTNASLFRHTNIRRYSSIQQTLDNPLSVSHAFGTGPAGGLAPADVKTAYDLTTTLEGEGQSVALYELDGYFATDIAQYTTQFAIPAPNIINVPVDGFSSAPGSGQDEVVLDIDMILALSPKIGHLYVYEGQNGTSAIVDTYQQIADDYDTNHAAAVSTSWGLDEADASDSIPAESTAFTQMEAQGQTIYASAGDNGAYDNGTTLSVDDPASQPNVTGVGGTHLTLKSVGGAYSSETSWNTLPLGAAGGPEGGGGGISTVWPKQSWETNVFPTISFRQVPDVSLDADPNTGFDIYVKADGGWNTFGGTSDAAPLWASFTDLVNELRAQSGLPTLGFANPPIYQIGAGANYNTDFHDIADGSTNLFYPAVAGYDMSTGWGTFIGEELLNDLAGNGFANLPKGTLGGVVTGPASIPIANATITAITTGSSEVVGKTTTDSTGTYTMQLPAGINLDVSADGSSSGAVKYAGETVDGIVVSTTAPTIQNFQLTVAQTFQPNTIQLISVPEEFSGIASFETLFGITDPLTSNDPVLFYWDPTLLEYIKTPAAPADTFHLGLGYWALFPNNTTVWYLHRQGIPASNTQTFSIALKQGWNMIGDPFTTNVPLTGITVDTVPSSTPVALASSSLVSLPLYFYVGGSSVYATLNTSTDSLLTGVGYWIDATAPATLILPAPGNGNPTPIGTH